MEQQLAVVPARAVRTAPQLLGDGTVEQLAERVACSVEVLVNCLLVHVATVRLAAQFHERHRSDPVNVT
ncbi:MULTISPECIES: hypothetical protein [Lentzea]|uniref:Uncharacterized protein n=1 Tax=Lentzea sokolovensis TaxID=3095429 RepID=A0ABU4UN59_9PSEU|nr:MULTISPECIES: hypothetical protein [Lentzea]MDX8140479.1 hypothetical protein [Lentzea sp. BCCO 10_0061]